MQNYDPKIGRFLTQDSLIPDLLNGQAWNAYAYVYNDTINLVDPSGHSPLGLAGFGGPYNVLVDPKRPHTSVRDQLRNAGRNGAQGVLNFLDWWQSKPDDCECRSKNQFGLNAANWLYNPTIGAWGVATTPAFKTAQYSLEYLSTSSFTWESAGTYVIDVSNSKLVGTPSFIQKPGPVNLSRQTLRNVKLESTLKMTGFAGSILGAGLLDAYFQLMGDINAGLCLAPKEYAYRALVGLLFGLAGGMIAAAATITAVAVGFPLLAAALVGIGTAFVYNWVIDTSGIKDWWLEAVRK